MKDAAFLMDNGNQLEGIGKALFKGLDENQFYILPHPLGKVLIKSRMSRILNGRAPDYVLLRAVFGYEAGDRSPTVMQIIRKALKS